jgi:hypothetical protein
MQIGHSKVGAIIVERDAGCVLMRHEGVIIGGFDCDFQCCWFFVVALEVLWKDVVRSLLN